MIVNREKLIRNSFLKKRFYLKAEAAFLLIRVGVLKLGNIGSAPLIEFLLDERAEREDIDVRVVGCGANMGPGQCEDVAAKILEFKPRILIIISPNAALPGPSRAREIAARGKVPTVVISDSPAKRILGSLEEGGFGYIIVEADSMIGARREFLDPVECAIFNADIIKVLAVTGSYSIIYQAIDKLIQEAKEGGELKLPRIIIDKESAVKAAGFQNPYAIAKAMAAYETSRKVADITIEACFKVKEWERYVALCSAAHEMMRAAARLADEVREIEKYGDSVVRRPHGRDGVVLEKRKLIEKPFKGLAL